MRMQGAVGATTLIDGRLYDYFSGTGYLGLQNHPQVIAAAADALQRYGISTATSRGGLGEHPLYDELDEAARVFFGCEKALIFSSGYMGPAVLMQGECRPGDHLFIDSGAHYALWDAAQACGRIITPYRHRDPAALREALRSDLEAGERPVVLTDGLFPISGEIAPLADLMTEVEGFGGLVIVDDAHALGVLGADGRGTADEFNLSGSRYLTSASLAKAMGGFGGVIWGTSGWIDGLEQSSSFCAGASPLPLVVAAASAAGLRLAFENPSWREKLWQNVFRARSGLKDLGLEIEMSRSPVICIPAGRSLNLARMRDGLYKEGIAVSLVRGYTGTPPGGALRIAIFATHTFSQIDRLIYVINGLN